ncbi:trypsin-like serine peptidase [Salipiger sp.]|uniref:trypsin-like serine peptidase n=1 Tax=Salipiger sp. TaxID=2078585 RepID=UPI003A97C1BE
MRRAAALALALAALFAAQGVRAQGQAVLDVMDNRGAMLGWEAVGRLDTPGGFCTGALIARDLVLTAAHCVFDRASAAPIPAGRILFRAGYHRGTQIAAREVSAWVVPPNYRPAPGGYQSGPAIASDVALLKLSSPIFSSEADPFIIHENPPEGSTVSVVSYGRGREEVLSRERDCAVVERYRNGELAFDCDVTFGSSGAPVFIRDNGRLRILAVMSAIRQDERGRTTVAFGPGVAGVVPALAARLRKDDSRATPGTGARRVGVGGERRAGGARFVRP